MTADERLADVFNRGLRDGVEALSPVDRDLFHIQEFIIEYEMNGLSGYFYNRLPHLDEITAAVDAMRKQGLLELAVLVGEAVNLFAGYTDPDTPTNWGEVLRRYDPADRLNDLQHRIRALDNFGLSRASIVRASHR